MAEVLPPADVADADHRPPVAVAGAGVILLAGVGYPLPAAGAGDLHPAAGVGDLRSALVAGARSNIAGTSLLSPSTDAEALMPAH